MATDDLAAVLARAARRLATEEEPVLAAHGTTMWEYIVLSRLASGPASNQLALAREVRHDKSRLVPLLDGLQARGLVERVRDPADRRSHQVLITEAGRTLQAGAQAAIRAMEQRVLSALTVTERRSLPAALSKLASAAPDHG